MATKRWALLATFWSVVVLFGNSYGASPPPQDHGLGGLRRIELTFLATSRGPSPAAGVAAGDVTVSDERSAKTAAQTELSKEPACQAIGAALTLAGLETVDRCRPDDSSCGTLSLSIETAAVDGSEDRTYLVGVELTQRMSLLRNPDSSLSAATTYSEHRSGFIRAGESATKTPCVRLQDLAAGFAAAWREANTRGVEDAADDPFKGPEDAPVTIVQFMDYQCRFCWRAQATIGQILDTYRDQVRFVVRDFPLEFHADARTAAAVAGCAQEEGKFWEIHDKLVVQSNFWKIRWIAHEVREVASLELDKLLDYAEKVGLDRQSLMACVQSGRRADEIDRDIDDGKLSGVRGTPTFFVNGQKIAGARPFDEFARAINDELSRKGQPIPLKPADPAAK